MRHIFNSPPKSFEWEIPQIYVRRTQFDQFEKKFNIFNVTKNATQISTTIATQIATKIATYNLINVIMDLETSEFISLVGNLSLKKVNLL